MDQEKKEEMKSLPQQVFEQFLEELKSQEVPEEMVKRLRKTLIENKQTTVDSVKAALFFTDDASL